MPAPQRLDMADAAARLERLAAHHRTTGVLEPDDYDDPELDALRAQGLAEVRARFWREAIPSRFQWARVDDFTGQARTELERWGTEPAGRNLLLLGPVGVGKSHAAVAAARILFDRGTEVRFLPVVELLDMLRPGGPEGALYDLAGLELLVLDDLGSERPTDWTAERLYALVNRRWLEERPTIITTNLPASELEQAVGARVYSRLVGNGSVGVGLSGPDRRRKGPGA